MDVLLITGAGSGIGRSHAVLMAERGADLIINDLNSEGLAETAECAASSGGKVIQVVHDVSDVAGMARRRRPRKRSSERSISSSTTQVSVENDWRSRMLPDAYDRMVDINLKEIVLSNAGGGSGDEETPLR